MHQLLRSIGPFVLRNACPRQCWNMPPPDLPPLPWVDFLRVKRSRKNSHAFMHMYGASLKQNGSCPSCAGGERNRDKPTHVRRRRTETASKAPMRGRHRQPSLSKYNRTKLLQAILPAMCGDDCARRGAAGNSGRATCIRRDGRCHRVEAAEHCG